MTTDETIKIACGECPFDDEYSYGTLCDKFKGCPESRQEAAAICIALDEVIEKFDVIKGLEAG